MGAALGHGSQRSKRYQEAPLICTEPFACCCPTGNRSRFRTRIPKEQEVPGSAADLHRALCLLLPHREQGAAEEPHGPSLDSPSTDCPSTLTTARGHIPLPVQRPSMEVSTVSPLFTSPTDGPAQCEINVSNMAMHFVTLLIGLCGLAGNGVVLWLLHVNAITHFISKQANIDFLFLIVMVPSTLLFLVEEVSCCAIMPLIYLSFLFYLSLFTYIMGLYRLMFISIQRCRSILCLVFCGCQLSEHLLWVLMTPLFWVLLFIFAAVNPTVTSLCQSHEQEQCRVAVTSIYALNLFLFAVPMLISSTILFIHLKPGSQQQPPKRLDIVIVLVALFSLPLSLWFLLQQLGYTVVPSQALFLLACINSSIKPFICFLVGSWKRDCSMGSCWRHCSMESCRKHSSMQSLREAIHRVFEEPEENTAYGGDPVVNTVI
ncbi:mas-related G-protein coupled receptor member A1-like [Camarhynchus parvulus]|uniref:mas-related G-protein coupled receptor member A1-like n=1 Tax=Geospiza parvula TaxID=87175 RepID=UPI00123830DA|nr:mas-related G-protein coupled receptor member A1-like [Camarhynchus parvulus]